MTNNTEPNSKPVKTKTNPLLGHGVGGWLMVRLQRYALLGWGVAFLVLILHFFVAALGAVTPRPVLVVDESGRVVGNLEILNSRARSDDELIAASKRYLSNCMSLNSATIYDDYAACMNMQTPELLAITKASLATDNYLPRVEKVKSRSWLEFSIVQNAPAIVGKHGMEVHIRLKGLAHVDLDGKPADSRPFDTTLGLRIVPRTSLNTSGIAVFETKDN